MQVAALRDTIAAFGKALATGWTSGLEPLYETIPHWQQAWPPAGLDDLGASIEQGLTNQQSRALWQGHAYFPKEVLIELAAFSPSMANLAFGRLFNQEVPLADRYSGFVFYLDEALAEQRRNAPSHARKTHPSHYHADYRAPSLYCALRYPSTEAYFEADVYLKALQVLKAPRVGSVAEPDRFAKSVKVALIFLGKDEQVQQAHLTRLGKADYREQPCALLASEYFRFLAT